MIRERCSCGAKFETDEANAIGLVRDWRKKHPCQTLETDDTPTSGIADTQIAMGFQPGELPAKEYDPWEDE
jgi:hypothetical protein